jgi:hypothetical protein
MYKGRNAVLSYAVLSYCAKLLDSVIELNCCLNYIYLTLSRVEMMKSCSVLLFRVSE